jgi:hypothetical protein
MMQLDFAGRILRENPQLNLALAGYSAKTERASIIFERFGAITNYLESRWQISPTRMKLADFTAKGKPLIRLNFEIAEVKNPAAQTAKIENAAIAF